MDNFEAVDAELSELTVRTQQQHLGRLLHGVVGVVPVPATVPATAPVPSRHCSQRQSFWKAPKIQGIRSVLLTGFLFCLLFIIHRDYTGMITALANDVYFNDKRSDPLITPIITHTHTHLQVNNSQRQSQAHDDNDDKSYSISPKIQLPFIVLVISARKHVERRKVIRETWATGHNNVFFVVSEPCPIPEKDRLNDAVCQARMSQGNKTLPIKLSAQFEREEKQLMDEHHRFGDIVFVSEPESYRGLVHKVKEALDWIIKNTTAHWILKADDDTFVRVDSVARYLEKLSPLQPTVVGRIVINAPVWKHGKWADPDYQQSRYPPWPMGSCGYALSRPIAEYVSSQKDQLYEYQGEDSSLGIWISESPFVIKGNRTLVWHNSRAFVNEGNCQDPNALVIGHLITPAKMRLCYDAIDEISNLPDHSLDRAFYPA